MKHLRSFFAVLLAAAVCAAVVLFSGCGASVQVQQLTIPGERIIRIVSDFRPSRKGMAV